ncbi:MAG: hypothetical protein AB1631_12525 [Acidobacteriota bacterium]
MPSNFDAIRRLYDNNQFAELTGNRDGVYWLKLRSISRPEQLREFCRSVGLECEGVASKRLFAHVYEHKPDAQLLESFIREKHQAQRAERLASEEFLISQLYQMRVFDWGGLYQNSLEQTIVDNYVKRIQRWDQLNAAIENELHFSLRGYVQCSWYNHWTSILIEDIFKDHPSVLPSAGLVKKVDFFIHDFPFDLKVTYFPDGYMKMLRRAEGLRPELTELKRFCRSEGIWFDNSSKPDALFRELLAKVAEHPAQSAREFFEEFKATRIRFIQRTVENPSALKVWLYENQGVRRFDASNRFFLILVNTENMEESWKLKRNKTLLVDAIHTHLSAMKPESMNDLRLEFNWQGRSYETYADALLVIVGAAQADGIR